MPTINTQNIERLPIPRGLVRARIATLKTMPRWVVVRAISKAVGVVVVVVVVLLLVVVLVLVLVVAVLDWAWIVCTPESRVSFDLVVAVFVVSVATNSHFGRTRNVVPTYDRREPIL